MQVNQAHRSPADTLNKGTAFISSYSPRRPSTSFTRRLRGKLTRRSIHPDRPLQAPVSHPWLKKVKNVPVKKSELPEKTAFVAIFDRRRVPLNGARVTPSTQNSRRRNWQKMWDLRLWPFHRRQRPSPVVTPCDSFTQTLKLRRLARTSPGADRRSVCRRRNRNRRWLPGIRRCAWRGRFSRSCRRWGLLIPPRRFGAAGLRPI